MFFGFWPVLFSTIALGLAWAVWWFRFTSKSVRSLRYALRNKIPFLTVEFDDGRTEIMHATEILPEGVIKTKNLNFTLPRASETTDEEEQSVNQLLTKKSTMEGVPHLVGYAGKAVASNVETLAAMEHAPNPTGKSRVIDVLGEKWKVFYPVDLRSLKTAMPLAFDQMLITSLEKKAELSGMLSAKKYSGQALMQIMPFMIIVLVLVFGIVAVLAFM